MLVRQPADLPAWQETLPRVAWGTVRDYVALTKPGIVVLLLVTAYCAMVVAAGGFPPLSVTAWTLLGLALSSGGANAVNMWYDRDIDGKMARTARRPIPSGRLPASRALAFGLILETISWLLLDKTVGLLPAFLSLAGFLYYVLVYTMWLKRRTPQNIVIGGGAGAFPPLVGWAAVTGGLSVASVLMFLVVFLWTPPHFWSLALYRQQDYRRAGIPMLPVVRGEDATKKQSLGYVLALVPTSLLLYATGTVGVGYLVGAAVLGALFLVHALRLLRERLPEVAWAKRTFRFSLLYLAALFFLMVVDVHPR